MMYKEICVLFKYCQKIGINAELESCFDGYKIYFPNGGDFIQHRYSYGSFKGCVEPAIGSRLDFSAVTLKQAMGLVKRHKDRLNGGADNA